MLNFRDELNKIKQDQKDEFDNQLIMTECLEALLCEFRRMKTVKSETFFFFRIHGDKVMKVTDNENKVLFEQEFQDGEKAKKFMAQIKKYFRDQNYKVEEFYFQRADFCLEIVI